MKPTSACNYTCSFCSSPTLSEDQKAVVPLEEVRQFLTRFPETNTIIVNGGDPLMMKPQYYWDMIAIMDELDSKATISFTSNLWAFYKKPEMWEDLFHHPRMGVATSFQYGEARTKGDGKPFTEQEFWAISDLMLQRVGYRPSFIAVITPDNENTVLQTVRLAKEMGVEAKINYAMGSGHQAGKTYVLADMYERYLEIYDAGLMAWEFNTKQMAVKIKGTGTTCPLNRECDDGIRALQPEGRYYSCGAFGDDNLYAIDFDQEMAGQKAHPLQNRPELQSMKQSCYECPMFDICNGCKKTIRDHKEQGLVETHCLKMKTLAPRIIAANQMTGLIEPTPYVEEYKPKPRSIPIKLIT